MTSGIAILIGIGIAAVVLFVIGIVFLAGAASVDIQDEFDMVMRERDDE